MTSNGCVFACTEKSENECLEKRLFGAGKIHEDKVLNVKKGTILFLYNLNSSVLYGPFKAVSDGQKNIEPKMWRGFYPYQVKVKQYNESIQKITQFDQIEEILELDWKDNLLDSKSTKYLMDLLENPTEIDLESIQEYVKKNKPIANQDKKPVLASTTLWDYPTQSYGTTKKGNNKYAGVTPAYIIYNMVKRYTERGDLVVDPMAGSGTTLDVCKEEFRKCKAFDIVSTRTDIRQNDARKIPLKGNTVDMVFIDSPYGDNIHYNDHPQNIGMLSAESTEFYDSLELVAKECHRILKPNKVIGWVMGDQWVQKKFTPVGFKLYQLLEKYLEPVDMISIARRNQTSNTGMWHGRAIRHNFYLRGHKHLLIFKKSTKKLDVNRNVSWQVYDRE